MNISVIGCLPLPRILDLFSSDVKQTSNVNQIQSCEALTLSPRYYCGPLGVILRDPVVAETHHCKLGRVRFSRAAFSTVRATNRGTSACAKHSKKGKLTSLTYLSSRRLQGSQ
jgi:hypothetical protein